MKARIDAIPGYTKELLGQSFLGTDIHGYSLNGGAGKPVILIEANIHGLHEWRTCYWVPHFMSLLSDTSLSPAPALFDRLVSRFAFYFLPTTNPDGYGTPTQSGPYQNGNLVNLNRNFSVMWENGPSDPTHSQYRGPEPFSEPESRIVRDKVLDLGPFAFISTHSWGGQTGLTVALASNTTYDQEAKDVHAAVKEVLSLGEDSYLAGKINQGLDTNWVVQQLLPDGRQPFAFAMEAGDRAPEFEQARMGGTGLLAFCLQAEAYYDAGSEPSKPKRYRDLYSSQYLKLI